MFRTILIGMIFVVSASMATAQTDYKKFEFFGGFSHNRIDTGIGDNDPELSDVIREREGFNGFETSITGNLSRYFGLKFDFSGHFKSHTVPFGSTASVDIDSQLYNVLGGVQLKDNSSETKFKPFAHALAGVARARNRVNFGNDVCIAVVPSPCPADFTDTQTGFAAALGGGLDIRAGNRVDVRVIQFDYNPTRLFDSTQHNFRIGVGIVFH